MRTTSYNAPIRQPARTSWNRFMFLAVLAAIWAASPAQGTGLARGVNEANKLAEEGHLDQALQKYREVRIEHPGVPEIDYNAASVRHMMGQYDSAAGQFHNVIASLNSPVAPSANYNFGNTLYRMQNLEGAVEAYKQALRLNPDDEDAKFNLELALRQLEQDTSSQQSDQEQQQQEQPDSNGTDQEQQQDQRQENPDTTGQNQNQDQNQPKPDTSDGQPPPEDAQPQEDPGEQESPQPQQVGMTKEDAERLLDALRDQELDVQRKRLQKVAQPVTVEKDW